MGNSCMAASSMEWDEEDWESLKQPKSSSSSSTKENDILGKLRASCDANGKVTLKISKSELVELLGAIQQNSNNNHQQPEHHIKKMKKKELGSAEQILFRLMKARNHEISGHWKPMLETIAEC